MDPGESTVGYPVDSRSECDAGAAAFVRAAAESRGHEFRVSLLGLGPVSYFNFGPSFLGFCILDYGGFWPVNQILIDGKKKRQKRYPKLFDMHRLRLLFKFLNLTYIYINACKYALV